MPGSQVLPGSTSLFLDNPLAGLTYEVQSEVANPDKAVLESVTFDDLDADVGRRRAPRQLLGRRPRLRRRSSPRNATTPYDKAHRAR